MKKILVALDGNVSSYYAANYGVKFAQKNNLEVGLVEISKIVLGGCYPGSLAAKSEEAKEKGLAKEHMKKIKDAYPDLSFEEFTPIGDPATEINKVIKEWHADILVIGHQTHNKFINFLGENTQKHILAHISVPTIIVPENYTSV